LKTFTGSSEKVASAFTTTDLPVLGLVPRTGAFEHSREKEALVSDVILGSLGVMEALEALVSDVVLGSLGVRRCSWFLANAYLT
jgi:hypothetical protein